ncbi:putative lipoprotein [Bacillus cereus]|nr:putative lipoprotein [Bacillus cereus]
MKQKLAVLLFTGIILSGCSTIAENSLESGKGSLELLTPTITAKDNELEIKTKGIDENKVTFIYVANKKVLEQKLKNGESYKLNIKDIEHAHRTDYKPKVQLLQTKDDDDDGEIVTFKQVRYTVKN